MEEKRTEDRHKTNTTPRVSHDLRNMQLTGKERVLSNIFGNAFTARIGPKTQGYVIDMMMSELPQPKREEILHGIHAVGIPYDLEEGLKRQRVRDEAIEYYAQLKRESGRGGNALDA